MHLTELPEFILRQLTPGEAMALQMIPSDRIKLVHYHRVSYHDLQVHLKRGNSRRYQQMADNVSHGRMEITMSKRTKKQPVKLSVETVREKSQEEKDREYFEWELEQQARRRAYAVYGSADDDYGYCSSYNMFSSY